MTLTQFRKSIKLKPSELSQLTGLSENYIKNNGGKSLNDFPDTSKKSFQLVKEVIELKQENQTLRSLIK